MFDGAPPGYDPVFWNELPADIRLELQHEARAATSHNPLNNRSSQGGSLLGKRIYCATSRKPAGVGAGQGGSCGVTTAILGSDSILPQADVQRWHRLLQGEGGAAVFLDEEFPATLFSITGKEDTSAEKESTTKSLPRPGYTIGQVPECFCHALSTKKAVKMNTPNQGREYYSCHVRRCKYFQWLDGDTQIPSQSGKHKACTW